MLLTNNLVFACQRHYSFIYNNFADYVSICHSKRKEEVVGGGWWMVEPSDRLYPVTFAYVRINRPKCPCVQKNINKTVF